MANIPLWRIAIALRPNMSPEEAHVCVKILSKCRYNIVQRCTDVNNSDYDNYGGRGITVCNEWADTTNGSANFLRWALTSGWTPGLEIDREDNNYGYYPDNCRWVSKVVNGLNRRTNVSYNLDVPVVILRDMMPDKSGKQAADLFRRGSRDEITDALIHSRELRVSHKNEAKDRLFRARCPYCGAETATIFRRRCRNGHMQPIGCPHCVSSADTYAAACDAGVFN